MQKKVRSCSPFPHLKNSSAGGKKQQTTALSSELRPSVRCYLKTSLLQPATENSSSVRSTG